jgi:3-dehydroquinate dehydratase-2
MLKFVLVYIKEINKIMKIQIINGPNLNLLGTREKDIYGDLNFEKYLDSLYEEFDDIEIKYYQSNVEGEIINKLHEVGLNYDGIVLNAGGYTHTSVAIADAIKAINSPVVEVHISNVFAREEFRQKTLIGPNCIGSISGFGLDSYKLAIESFRLLEK